MLKTENYEAGYDTPERNLWAAVISQAMEDYFTDPFSMKCRSKQKRSLRDKNEAKYWLLKSKRKDIGSFFWICAQLELDAELIRRQIAAASNFPPRENSN